MIKKLLTITALILLSGCASKKPLKIPMNPSNQAHFNEGLAVNFIDNNAGFAMCYSPKNVEVITFSPEMIPVALLTSAVLNTTENLTPKRAAQAGADRIFALIKPDDLNIDFFDRLKNDNRLKQKINISNVQRINETNTGIKKGMHISLSYAFNLKAEILFVGASVKVYAEDAPIPKTTKYKKNSIQPIYSNSFFYFSKFRSAPTKPQEEIDTEINKIKNEYKEKYRKIPKKGYTGYDYMQKKIRIASRDYTVVEKTNLSLDKWLGDNAREVRDEVNNAHKFIIDQIYRDYNNYETPDIKGKDRILETLEDGRYVQIIGSGVSSGQIESLPSNGITDVQKNEFFYGSVFIYPKK